MPITIEKLKELITCDVCLDTFNSPKALQCLHTFCENCIQKIIQPRYLFLKPGLTCPSCRQFTEESDLKGNFHMVQLVDLYMEATQPKKCVNCKTNKGNWKCNECVEYFCDRCKEGHLSVRVLRHHKMTLANDEATRLVIDKPVNCRKHPDEMIKYNCKVCDELLCITCSILLFI